MSQKAKQLHRLRKWSMFLLLLVDGIALSGCRTFSFYRQAIAGQFGLWANSQRIDKLLAYTNTPPTLRYRLVVVHGLPVLGDEQLKLFVYGHYKKYVDVHRPFVVWNVQSAPEFSMEPKTWSYPFIGSQEYRGYFHKDGADDYSKWL